MGNNSTHILLKKTYFATITAIRKILAEPLAISGGLLVISGVLANFLNFLGSTFLTRSQAISFDQLGVIGLIGGFSTVSDVIFGAVNKTVMFKTAYLYGKHNRIIKSFWELILKYSFFFGVVITVLWYLSIPFLSRFFSASVLSLLLSAPIWLLTIIIVVNDGFLTGAHKFFIIAGMAISEAAIKLIATILFVQLGHADLVYLAFPISLLSTFVISTAFIFLIPVDKRLQEVPDANKVPRKFFFSSLGFKVSSVLFLAGDVLLAKHYLSPTLAGQYILLSTIGRMVYFLGSIFVTFISPLVSKNEGAQKNSKKLFRTTFYVTILANLFPILGIGVFGFITIPFIFANKGAIVIPYLFTYTLAMSFFSVAGLITNYHQARNHNSFSAVAIVFALFQTIGIILHQHTIEGFVTVVFITSFFYVISLLIFHFIYESGEHYLKTLSQIFPWYIRSVLSGELRQKKRIVLPKKIEQYSFLKDLSPRGFPFATGLYLDPSGEEVVIKVWTGSIKSIYYFNILHQIEMTRILTTVQNRFLKKHTSSFRLPRFIKASISDKLVYLIMEKVAGKSMEEQSNTNTQFKIYTQCLHFLEELSNECNSEERKKITVKQVKDFIFLYPIILIASITMHPNLIFTLLKGVPHFIFGIPILLTMKPDRLVHGDLHPDNILVKSSSSFYLLDIENMRFCYPIYESISAASLKGNSSKMKELLISELIQPTKSKRWQRAVSALMINNITHNLTGDLAPASIRSYLYILKLAVGLSKNV